ncbi:MAG: hypothetical protein GC181_12990 [Bacteroidetes bacterium]|nr:hypothetical protein [Bacteroidota bacterium]
MGEMSVLDQLAVSLGRRDEVPNIELAERISQNKDTASVKELISALKHKNKNIQADCIKVLYEVGDRSPDLIAPYLSEFLALLKSKNNRMQWGGMAALSAIVKSDSDGIYHNLTTILDAADNGTVITKDNAVNILIYLCGVSSYRSECMVLLMEQLKKSAVNQLPMYAERSLPVIDLKSKEEFISILNSRLSDLEKESSKKRLLKVLKVAGKM